jgi:lysophospholipase L1-like esterase
VASFILHLVDALWHVAGLLLLLVLFTEYGIDGLRRASRRLRLGQPTRVDRSATADAYRGAAWSIPYFEEFRRGVRTDWKPYVGWWQRPFRGTYVSIDERGLRLTPGERDATPGAVRIWCFGGSTMMGMGVRDAHTIPALLARRLAENGHTVAVTNLGQLAHNSTQEAISLHQLLKKGTPPDVAVFYDGVNDMMAAEQTGDADRMFHEAARRAEFNLLFPDRRRDLAAAALIALFPRTLRRLRAVTGLALRGPASVAPTDLTGRDLEDLARRVVGAYAANLRLVGLMAKAHGLRALFFWQPVITTKQVKSPDEQYFAAQFTTDTAARQRLYDAIIAARKRHPDLVAMPDAIDLSRLFDGCQDPVYIDFYHLSEPANAVVVEAMLPAVEDAVRAARQGETGRRVR